MDVFLELRRTFWTPSEKKTSCEARQSASSGTVAVTGRRKVSGPFGGTGISDWKGGGAWETKCGRATKGSIECSWAVRVCIFIELVGLRGEGETCIETSPSNLREGRPPETSGHCSLDCRTDDISCSVPWQRRLCLEYPKTRRLLEWKLSRK